MQRFAHAHPLLHDADGKSTQYVDQRDQNGRDGVAAHEFAGPVHCSVKVRLLLDLPPPLARLRFVDHSRVQLRINGQLLAGHGVQSKSRRHFRDAPRALGDDDEIYQYED